MISIFGAVDLERCGPFGALLIDLACFLSPASASGPLVS